MNVTYVDPEQSARLNKRLATIRSRPLGHRAAVLIALSLPFWLVIMFLAGIGLSGSSEGLGAFLLIVGMFALFIPAWIYTGRMLVRIGVVFCSLGASVCAALIVPPAWLLLIGRTTAAVITSLQRTTGCTDTNSGCYGDFEATLRPLHGSGQLGTMMITDLGGRHVGSVLTVTTDPLGLLAPALNPSAAVPIGLSVAVVIFLALAARPLLRAQRAAYQTLLSGRVRSGQGDRGTASAA